MAIYFFIASYRWLSAILFFPTVGNIKTVLYYLYFLEIYVHRIKFECVFHLNYIFFNSVADTGQNGTIYSEKLDTFHCVATWSLTHCTSWVRFMYEHKWVFKY